MASVQSWTLTHVQLFVPPPRKCKLRVKTSHCATWYLHKNKKWLLFFRSWDMVVTGKQNDLQPRKQNGKMSFLFKSLSHHTCECFVRMLAIADGLVVYLFLYHFYRSYVSFSSSPYVVCRKVKFSVSLLGRGGGMWPLPVMPLVSHRTNPTWTCSNLFTWGPPTYVADTSIGKRAVGFQLKGPLHACMCTLEWTMLLLSSHNEQHLDSFNTKQKPSVQELRISFFGSQYSVFRVKD